MSSEKQVEFTKENIDLYLKEVAKEYRKQVGKNMPAEFVLIGGASVLINYGFRNMTTDIDALIEAASAMKDAINRVGDQYELPNGWLNADFKNTDSYSAKLSQFSTYGYFMRKWTILRRRPMVPVTSWLAVRAV